VRVVEFPAFAACALAGMGDLPETILDRSVIVAMKRRAPHEHVESFRDRLARPGAESLRDRLADWAEANLDELRATWPEMPTGIVDRAADVWEPLVAIADQAEGDWPTRAREAAVKLNQARAERDPSLGVQLLSDCRALFTARNVDRLTTEALLEALHELDESPWNDLRGKPLDARGLARRLRKYEVRPDVHRFDDGLKRGYRTEDFHDSWQRYLPEQDAAVTPVTHVTHPQRETGEGSGVTSVQMEGEGNLLSIPLDIPLSTNGEALQALHPQHDDEPEAVA
jgi:Protein of unknown function (DUF3631)